jgi:hypothetical protein
MRKHGKRETNKKEQEQNMRNGYFFFQILGEKQRGE